MRVTEWFPPDTRPVRCGVYMTRYFSMCVPFWRYWNGRYWLFTNIRAEDFPSPSAGQARTHGLFAQLQDVQWCGIYKDEENA